jgi:putative transposase
MARAARGLVGGQIYHVLNRGNGRANVFHKPGDFAAFVNLLGEAKQRHPVKLLAYCLMTNHFHLLVQPAESEDLSKWMRWLMTSHVRRYHRHYGTSGHIWQGRFKSFIVGDDNHLLTVMRYVEGNPVQAQMVKSARDWPWSSHLANLGTVSERSEVTVPFDEMAASGSGSDTLTGASPYVGVGQAPFKEQMEPVPIIGSGTGTLTEASPYVGMGQAPFKEQMEPVPIIGSGTGTLAGASPYVGVGQAPFKEQMEPVPIVDTGVINLPDDWTTYVDTPLTGKEMNSLKRSLHRQVPFGPEPVRD